MPSPVKIIDNRTKKRIWLSEVIESSKKGKRFKPNLDLTVYNAWMSNYPMLKLKTDSLGLRSRDLDLNPTLKSTPIRLLFLGDSITWSGYLPEENTFVFMLQELLNKKERNKVITINGGIGDVGIEEEISLLNEAYEKIRPRMVILMFYLNDSRPPAGFESEKKLAWAKFLQKSRLIDIVYNNFQLQLYFMRHNILGKSYRYRWLYMSKTDKWKKDPVYFGDMAKEADLDWGAAWNEDSWEVIKKNIMELKKTAIEKDFNLLIACLPVSFQVYSDFLDTRPQDKIASIALSENIKFIDLLPALRRNNKLALFYDHCHLNAEGQRIVAGDLAEYILNHFEL
ncbi:MAG: SGNH/GDSL hydrolase family protein [Candidatus Omnitrophota bacterium]